jgi:hypothetical protein
MFESSRCAEEKHLSRSVAFHAKAVGNVARSEHKGTRTSVNPLAVANEGDVTRKYVERFIFPSVSVIWAFEPYRQGYVF